MGEERVGSGISAMVGNFHYFVTAYHPVKPNNVS